MNCLICHKKIQSNYRLCTEHNNIKEEIIQILKSKKITNINEIILQLEYDILTKPIDIENKLLRIMGTMEYSRSINNNYDSNDDYYSNYNNDRIKMEINFIKRLICFKEHIIDQNKNNLTQTDARKKWPTNIRCNDGHYVRSRAEKIIDDWLYDNDIKHEYERTLFLNNKEYLPDFYLPRQDIYIEYCEMNKDHTEDKINEYKKASLNIIGIYDKDIDNINDILIRNLKKFNYKKF